MNEKKRVLLLVLIMATACLAVAGTTIAILYRAAFEEQRNVLESIAKNHARLLEEMARFDAVWSRDYPGGPASATLNQVINAHRDFEGIGHTGEFTLGRREGNMMVFLITRRYGDSDKREPLPMDSKLAEPMRRALSGLSGTVVGLDYRGETVLAAYEPVADLNWGIVAKVDLAELRVPFIQAGATALAIAALVVLAGALSFIRITNPIIRRLREHAQSLTDLVASLRKSEQSLQKARDELELRVEERTEDLVLANNRLEHEVRERTRAEDRLRALWKISEMTDAKDEELYDHILQGTLQMTHSRYAFYGFLNADESAMSVYSWSKEALEACRMAERPIRFQVDQAGIWAEAIRQRRVLVVNDYEAENPGKRGIPEGHVQLTRLLVAPVFGFGRVVSLVLAANKPADYDDDDVKQLEAFANGVQMIIDRRKMEKSLRASEKECRLLSRQVMGAQEKERKRVAREIHDGICQSLAAVKYRAEGCLSTSERDPAAMTHEIQSIIQMMREAMEEVRRIQNDLHPAHLELVGILGAISEFCAQLQGTYSRIETNVRFELSEPEVPEYLKAPIFRICQEAMNNAAKHSGAKRINVTVQKSNGALELIIEDDGAGFGSNDGAPSHIRGKGSGLRNMRERAELSGGHLEFRSAPGQGTAVFAAWPLQHLAPVSDTTQ